MPKILIRNLNNTQIEVTKSNDSILKIIHDHNIDWMFSCGGKGKCTTCRLVVHKGIEHLSELKGNEEKFMEIGRLKDNERLACQHELLGDLEVSVAEPNKFPHVTYTE